MFYQYYNYNNYYYFFFFFKKKKKFISTFVINYNSRINFKLYIFLQIKISYFTREWVLSIYVYYANNNIYNLLRQEINSSY